MYSGPEKIITQKELEGYVIEPYEDHVDYRYRAFHKLLKSNMVEIATRNVPHPDFDAYVSSLLYFDGDTIKSVYEIQEYCNSCETHLYLTLKKIAQNEFLVTHNVKNDFNKRIKWNSKDAKFDKTEYYPVTNQNY